MIKDNSQLKATREYLENMEEIVANMSKEDIHPTRLRIWLEPYLNEIRKAHFEIDEYLGIRAAEEERSAVWIRLEGPSIIDGAIPVKFLSRFTNDFQQLVYQVAKNLSGISIDHKRDKQEVEIEKQCRLLVMSTSAGSFQMGFEFDFQWYQKDLYRKNPIPIESLMTILQIAMRLATAKGEKLDDLVADVRVQNRVLSTMKRLAPAKAVGIETVEIYPRKEKEIRFDMNLRKYIAQLIRSPEQEIREESGTVREIDLDRKRFGIRQPDGNRLQCRYKEAEELEETIISAVNHYVIVTGSASVDPKTKKTRSIEDVIDISIQAEGPEFRSDELF